ncbi:MAG: hypothetical protein RIR48_2730 [Bacteroidota bacterium]|jgi:hypothetical protein
MKITVNQLIEKTLELPKYFKSGNERFYMILDEKTLLYVKDFSKDDEHLEIYPLIEQGKISYYADFWAKYGIEAITEQEFKDAFIRVSLRLEEKMN